MKLHSGFNILLKSKNFYSQKNLNDPTYIQSQGAQKALSLFYKSAKTVPAYKDFLKKNKIKSSTIKSPKDFKNIPVTTKKNYIEKYSLKDRCFDGSLSSLHMVSASSGSTGSPIFWPRDIHHEVEGALSHELILKNIFHIDKISTLFVISFSMGNWIAGTFTQACANFLAYKGYELTIATPGLSEDETIKVVKNLSPLYQQTIIAGYPPMIKMLIENNKKVNWEKINPKFIGAGEGFSENWRDYLHSMIGNPPSYKTFINIFGSADAGLMGHETPLSIALRRYSFQNPHININLFKDARSPYLYQFDPRLKFIESVNQELTLTTNTGTPLIRYNIEDHGDVITHNKLNSKLKIFNINTEEILKSNHLDLVYDWKLPFVYLFGRKHFVATIYGLNVYPENIRSILEHKAMQKISTGKFILKTTHTKNQDQQLLLRIELKPNIKIDNALREKINRHTIRVLKSVNSEYNKLETSIGPKAHPVIKLHRYNHPKYFPCDKIRKSS